MRFTLPLSFTMFALPLLSGSGTTTRFGMVWPATTLRLDAVGRPMVNGYTVTTVWAVGSVAVTLAMRPEAPTGTPVSGLMTWTAVGYVVPQGRFAPCRWRLSRIRVG